MKMYAFFRRLIKNALEDDIFEMANGLTYRMMFAFFPFLVFLMSLVGYMNLDEAEMTARLYAALPADISDWAWNILAGITRTRSSGLLSTSLFFSVYNTANGFRAIIRCINKAHGYTDSRGILKRTGISLLLMLIFTLSVLVMIALLIFGGDIWNALSPSLPDGLRPLFELLSSMGSMLILAAATTLIYKMASAVKVRALSVLPGAIVTVALWVFASKIFSYFIKYFSSYSTIYGSIAGVFILLLWLNIIAIILLLGNEINSALVVE
ncbi:MAG: YihY/virulence factor BrkB family protein [Clostridiales bacterium]|jgi:membrane protein|nr:YihY/virulence factor BrkB family protein [Clostridiales bacterium]